MSEPWMINVSFNAPTSENWRAYIPTLRESLLAYCRAEGLTPLEAPEAPHSCESEIDGAIRFICAYNAFPIVGLEYTGEDDDNGNPIPLRDDEGNFVYIYGEPCWVIRADTVVNTTLGGVSMRIAVENGSA